MLRADKIGAHRASYEKNRKRILATQDHCGICGKPVEKHLKAPDPMSPCVDHIVPLSKGGHPSDLANLQLAHWTCNRLKSDRLLRAGKEKVDKIVVGNRNLHQSKDWAAYRS